MTIEDVEEIKAKHRYILERNTYSVIEVRTGKQVAFAVNEKDLCHQLGLRTEKELHEFLSDVKECPNSAYKVELNTIDIRNPFAIYASGVSEGKRELSKQEWFDTLVLRDIYAAVNDEVRRLESYLVLSKEKRVTPDGFADWDQFKLYYKSLEKWRRFRSAGLTKKMPPLRDGPKVAHSGAMETYEPPSQKVAQVGCGIIGLSWFTFIGFSFLLCIFLKVSGCVKGCSSSVPSEYDEWKSENPPWL